jgi:phosphatidylglycerol---prolipoprotein diacylglyceryl transferase
MRPIPVVFHIGPLQVHTYGIGLALTFWFAFTYFERRLKKNGYPTDWFVGVFLWIVLAAVVGARTLHVLSNLSYYTHNPSQVLAIWHGGLSSFGGLLFAVPTGLILTRRRCPELPIGRALDLIAPVL